MVRRIRLRNLLQALVILAIGMVVSMDGDGADPVLNIESKHGEIVLSWPSSAEGYYVENTQALPGGWALSLATRSRGERYKAVANLDFIGFRILQIERSAAFWRRRNGWSSLR